MPTRRASRQTTDVPAKLVYSENDLFLSLREAAVILKLPLSVVKAMSRAGFGPSTIITPDRKHTWIKADVEAIKNFCLGLRRMRVRPLRARRVGQH